MKTEKTDPLKRVVLVSTPWPLYSRPSIQLGTLKAYLRRDFPKLKVHALHIYLKVAESIGYKLYGAISERTWLAEVRHPTGLPELGRARYGLAGGQCSDARSGSAKS